MGFLKIPLISNTSLLTFLQIMFTLWDILLLKVVEHYSK